MTTPGMGSLVVIGRLSAQRNYTLSPLKLLLPPVAVVLLLLAVLQALSDHGFPVPTAIDNNRHAVLMELVDAQPLVQVGQHTAHSTLHILNPLPLNLTKIWPGTRPKPVLRSGHYCVEAAGSTVGASMWSLMTWLIPLPMAEDMPMPF